MAPVVLYSVCCFYVPLALSLCTVPANAYPQLTFPLEVQFDGHFAAGGQHTVNQMTGWPFKGDSCPALCLLVLSAVSCQTAMPELILLRHREISSMLSAPAHRSELCGTVHLQTMPLTFPFFARTNRLE